MPDPMTESILSRFGMSTRSDFPPDRSTQNSRDTRYIASSTYKSTGSSARAESDWAETDGDETVYAGSDDEEEIEVRKMSPQVRWRGLVQKSGTDITKLIPPVILLDNDTATRRPVERLAGSFQQTRFTGPTSYPCRAQGSRDPRR